MEEKLLSDILSELREIKQDLQWLKSREARRERAQGESLEELAKLLTDGKPAKAKVLSALAEASKKK